MLVLGRKTLLRCSLLIENVPTQRQYIHFSDKEKNLRKIHTEDENSYLGRCKRKVKLPKEANEKKDTESRNSVCHGGKWIINLLEGIIIMFDKIGRTSDKLDGKSIFDSFFSSLYQKCDFRFARLALFAELLLLI